MNSDNHKNSNGFSPNRAILRTETGQSGNIASGANGRHGGRTVGTPLPNYASSQESVLVWCSRLLYRNKWFILLAVVCCGIGAIAYGLIQRPVYRATAKIEIQGVNENFLGLHDVDPLTPMESGDPSSYIDAQAEILQSRSLVQAVISKLNATNSSYFAPKIKTMRLWNTIFRTKVASQDPRNEVLQSVLDRLAVTVSRQSHLIDIQYDDGNPALAAAFLNELAKEYSDASVDGRWAAMRRTGVRLNDELVEMKQQLQTSERNLQSYAAGAGLLFTEGKESVADARLHQVQEALSHAESERVAKQAQFELIQHSQRESLSEVLDDRSLREMESRGAILKQQLAQMQVTFQPTYYKVEELKAQIAELERSTAEQKESIVQRIQNDFEAANRKEKLLADSYRQQSSVVLDQAGKAVEYDMLKRGVDSSRQLYDSLLQKVKEAEVRLASTTPNVRLIDAAEVPTLPFKPNIPTNAIVGALVGLMLSSTFVLVRHLIDRRLRLPGETLVYLDIPELGVIPSMGQALPQNGKAHRSLSNNRTMLPLYETKKLPPVGMKRTELAPNLATWHKDPTAVTDSFRSALTAIIFNNGSREGANVYAITSPNQQEGKTTIASNLAVALAETGRRVLLIDGDLRHPQLHSIFGLSNTRGLGTILEQDFPIDAYELDEILHAAGRDSLFILPAGPARSKHTVSLLTSRRLSDLLDRLRTEFDVILVDTTPMLGLPDARLIAHLTHGAILVFRLSVTSRSHAMQTRDMLFQDNTPVLGSILNDCREASHNNSYYSGNTVQ